MGDDVGEVPCKCLWKLRYPTQRFCQFLPNRSYWCNDRGKG